jgi:hypothetical protein
MQNSRFPIRLSLANDSANLTPGYEIDTRPVPWFAILRGIYGRFAPDSRRFLSPDSSFVQFRTAWVHTMRTRFTRSFVAFLRFGPAAIVPRVNPRHGRCAPDQIHPFNLSAEVRACVANYDANRGSQSSNQALTVQLKL